MLAHTDREERRNCYVSAHGPRRTPQLIGHRILFLGRKILSELKNFHGGLHCILKNSQISVAVYFIGHFPSSLPNYWRPLINGESSAA
jgi:hypothetical protein